MRDSGVWAGPGPVDKSEGLGGRAGLGPVDKSEGFGGRAGRAGPAGPPSLANPQVTIEMRTQGHGLAWGSPSRSERVLASLKLAS